MFFFVFCESIRAANRRAIKAPEVKLFWPEPEVLLGAIQILLQEKLHALLYSAEISDESH